MPRPAGSEVRYLPGLDGIRALAVAAVVGYHLGTPWLPGGLLGVDVFFALSGYLITTILITTWDGRGDLDLKHFWLRRARRLLPALIMVLIVVLIATPVLDNDVLPQRGIEALAALFFVSNCTTIASGVSYSQRFSGPGPLDHLWSLAVEEQLFMAAVLLPAVQDTAADSTWMALVTRAGRRVVRADVAAGGSRLQQLACVPGTDTRAGGLLIGAALASVATYSAGQQDHREPRCVHDLGGAGLAIIVTMFVRRTSTPGHYRGGILLSLATAVLWAAVHPASVVGPVLGVLPLRWIGERSYGIYLWHLPVVAFMLKPSGYPSAGTRGYSARFDHFAVEPELGAAREPDPPPRSDRCAGSTPIRGAPRPRATPIHLEYVRAPAIVSGSVAL